MSDEPRIVITSEPTISAEEVSGRTFATAFRGYDTAEVRTFLRRVSDELATLRERERELRRRLDEAERRPLDRPLDEATLTSVLGEETARVLRSAREAAAEIGAKTEQKVARMVSEAQEEAARLRAEAEGILARRVEEADQLAAGIRHSAEEDAETLRRRAHDEAEGEIEAARARGREMIGEAQALRERILGDLARRRHVGHAQIEQLRAGRDRLLDAYRMVRQTLDEVTAELTAAEAEARVSAEAAGMKVAAEAEATLEELEAELALARTAAPSEPAPAAEAERTPAVAPAEKTPAEKTEARPEPIEPKVERPVSIIAEPAPRGRLSSGTATPKSMRILRRSNSGGSVELDVIEAPAADEGVRVIASEAGLESEAPGENEVSEAPAVEGAAPVVEEAPASEGSEEQRPKGDVDALFARIKASRAKEVAAAESVLAAVPSQLAQEAAPPAEAAPEASGAVSNQDESALQRRDELLDPIDAQMLRRLKRALQDDQNAALDALRTGKRKPSLKTVFPVEDEHLARYRDVVAPLLEQAAQAGGQFAAGGGDAPFEVPDVGDLADDLARDLVHGLRERVGKGIEESSAAGDGESELVGRVSAVYREWKLQRIEPLSRHASAGAFGRAAFDAYPKGAGLRWVVDDDGGGCPDCEDDALAGATPKGDDFPTGQRHPPAHPGCRCLLLPAAQ